MGLDVLCPKERALEEEYECRRREWSRLKDAARQEEKEQDNCPS